MVHTILEHGGLIWVGYNNECLVDFPRLCVEATNVE